MKTTKPSISNQEIRNRVARAIYFGITQEIEPSKYKVRCWSGVDAKKLNDKSILDFDQMVKDIKIELSWKCLRHIGSNGGAISRINLSYFSNPTLNSYILDTSAFTNCALDIHVEPHLSH
jgi:hypothetical protein